MIIPNDMVAVIVRYVVAAEKRNYGEYQASKIAAIKTIRTMIPNLGLKEAKDLVEAVDNQPTDPVRALLDNVCI